MRLREFLVSGRAQFIILVSPTLYLYKTMSSCQKAVRPLSTHLRPLKPLCHIWMNARAFSNGIKLQDDAETHATAPPDTTISYNPLTVTSIKGERALMRSGVNPIGSRRRRAALKTSDNIPFEQLPYQCFQEARKVLQTDREEKLQAIELERTRIAKVLAKDASTIKGGEAHKQVRLSSMRRHLEKLKILADINDPLIKKRFEDGEGMD